MFRQPCGNTNGHTVDRQGRLVSCEHSGRRVSRTEFDGSIITIADKWQGKRFNSPNDAVVKSDGSIWFTDPAYGIESDYEGDKAESEIGACHVYRVDPGTGAGRCRHHRHGAAERHRLLARRKEALRRRYRPHPWRAPPRPHARLQRRRQGQEGQGGKVFADCTAGLFDGFRLDDQGNIWTSAGDGVHCYAPDGTLIGKVKVPEVVANVCFGGAKLNCLYIAGTTSLYMVRLMVNGAKTY